MSRITKVVSNVITWLVIAAAAVIPVALIALAVRAIMWAIGG